MLSASSRTAGGSFLLGTGFGALVVGMLLALLRSSECAQNIA